MCTATHLVLPSGTDEVMVLIARDLRLTEMTVTTDSALVGATGPLNLQYGRQTLNALPVNPGEPGQIMEGITISGLGPWSATRAGAVGRITLEFKSASSAAPRGLEQRLELPIQAASSNRAECRIGDLIAFGAANESRQQVPYVIVTEAKRKVLFVADEGSSVQYRFTTTGCKRMHALGRKVARTCGLNDSCGMTAENATHWIGPTAIGPAEPLEMKAALSLPRSLRYVWTVVGWHASDPREPAVVSDPLIQMFVPRAEVCTRPGAQNC